jgi:hemerythrin-like domain-containing protein
MNTATQNLENDHLYILRLVYVMEKMVVNLSTDSGDLDLVVDLIRKYVDGFHHAKEENLLFPLLLKKGFSDEHGPVAAMLNEHAESRKYVKEMCEGIDKFNQGDDNTIPDIYLNMQCYIDLLRAHIGKENNVLFRLVDKVLNSKEQADLLAKFESVERNDFTKEKIQKYITDIEGLEVIFME